MVRQRKNVKEWWAKHRIVRKAIVCRVCGKMFTPRSSIQKNCSKECMDKWGREYLCKYLMNRYKTDKEFRRKWIDRCVRYNARIAAAERKLKRCKKCGGELGKHQRMYCDECSKSNNIKSTLKRLDRTLKGTLKTQRRLLKLLRAKKI